MAMPPTAAPMPADAGGTPPDDMGGAQPDAGNADQGGEDCILTVCKDPAGGFILYAGDEPEELGEGTAAEEGAEAAEGDEGGQHFDTPQALMQGIMKMLNNDGGAEDSFAKGFRGEPDETAGKPPGAPMPMA